jgi:hypothetical protein
MPSVLCHYIPRLKEGAGHDTSPSYDDDDDDVDSNTAYTYSPYSRCNSRLQIE